MWVSEAVDRSWETTPNVYWNTNFTTSASDASSQYTSEAAASVIVTKGHRIKAISKYDTTYYKPTGSYQTKSSLAGVIIYPQF
ncbi:hypothetical protein [Alkaliphilus hydrothermalis]|uniref:Uncharacterized protein n=1 Tax=Alkaliphilus hydrothermalis TaxID=1482730 RepID=A0ABS2NRT1_9FIRM|nr:hypothetical protein [Alkaliphilus hydrothermalis]MBM7615675.1 hypothetical protein [Alkaliphilus hydrothermalis]